MASSGANLEHLLIRTTTISLVLQGLLVELRALDPIAATRVKQFALDLVADLKAYPATGPQVGGHRLEVDVEAFFEAIEPDGPHG